MQAGRLWGTIAFIKGLAISVLQVRRLVDHVTAYAFERLATLSPRTYTSNPNILTHYRSVLTMVGFETTFGFGDLPPPRETTGESFEEDVEDVTNYRLT